MDLQSVKNMTGYSNTTKHDVYFTEILPLMIEFAKDKCQNSFLVDGVETLPGGVKIFIAKAIEYNMGDAGLKGRTMGEVSYSYETDFPKSILKYLSPYKKVRFR